MSAGNQVLFSGNFAPVAFPYNNTVLGIGNYWIEEIDFILTYATTSAAAFSNTTFILQTTVSFTTVSTQNFAMSATAASSLVFNIPVICRPRIFLPRTNALNFIITNVTAGISQIICSLDIYGRTLP